MEPHRFCVVWDNTQKLVVSRDQCRSSANKMLLWANAYAARNRVPDHSKTYALSTMAACDIPLLSFLPSAEDADMLREHMAVIVARILVSHIDYFSENCSAAVTCHIYHPNTSASAVKTQLVIFFFSVHTFALTFVWYRTTSKKSCKL